MITIRHLQETFQVSWFTQLAQNTAFASVSVSVSVSVSHGSDLTFVMRARQRWWTPWMYNQTHTQTHSHTLHRATWPSIQHPAPTIPRHQERVFSHSFPTSKPAQPKNIKKTKKKQNTKQLHMIYLEKKQIKDIPYYTLHTYTVHIRSLARATSQAHQKTSSARENNYAYTHTYTLATYLHVLAHTYTYFAYISTEYTYKRKISGESNYSSICTM